MNPTAVIADDEPLLRDALERMLAVAWPALRIVAQARNGREAIELFERHAPQVCFLDVHMPGTSGIEVAQRIGRRAHLVFVTAYHDYAVQAFDHGVLDYLVKPVQPERLADTVSRLRERIEAAQPASNTELLIQQLATKLRQPTSSSWLRWIRASVGQTVRLIAVDDIEFLRSEDKYTRVAWRDDMKQPLEALVRMTIKELASKLDPERFVQIHRSVIVNLSAVSHVTRSENETATLYLKGRSEVLPVSRHHVQLFRQM